MEILGIGPLEAIFIVLLALIAIGPRDLGTTARSLGRTLNRVYRSEAWHSLTQASRNLRGLPNRLAREAALEELDHVRRELKDGPPPPTLPGQWQQPAGSAPGPVGPGLTARPQPEVVGSDGSKPTGPEPEKKTRATKLPSGVVSRGKVTRSAVRSPRKSSRGNNASANRRPPRSGPRKKVARATERPPRSGPGKRAAQASKRPPRGTPRRRRPS